MNQSTMHQLERTLDRIAKGQRLGPEDVVAIQHAMQDLLDIDQYRAMMLNGAVVVDRMLSDHVEHPAICRRQARIWVENARQLLRRQPAEYAPKSSG